jgi:hypothetical protein
MLLQAVSIALSTLVAGQASVISVHPLLFVKAVATGRHDLSRIESASRPLSTWQLLTHRVHCSQSRLQVQARPRFGSLGEDDPVWASA